MKKPSKASSLAEADAQILHLNVRVRELEAELYKCRGKTRTHFIPGRSTNVEIPAHPPQYLSLDIGIKNTVELLRKFNIETVQSCEGGKGHSYPEPTIEFCGTQEAGYRAVSICIAHGLPISKLYRFSNVEGDELTGPYWAITFKRRPG